MPDHGLRTILNHQKLNPTDEEVVQETAVASSPVAGWNNDIWTEEGNEEDIDLEELGRALFEATSMASFSKKRHAKPTVKSSPLSPETREVYEYMGAWNTNSTCFRFRKCLDANPSQCFRYAHGGKTTSGYGRGRRPREMQALWPFNALRDAIDTCSLVFSSRTI
ncbi:hypothetical protein AAG906_021597 [Vitis piasezkii]